MKLLTDPDFINLARFNFSLKEALARYPEGLPDNLIARALMINEEEVQARYDTIVNTLREKLRA